MRYSIGADSEVGRLRSVLMHRPGPELRRITPRTRSLWPSGGLRGLPWADRAQQEHDQLADTLRASGAEVIYLTGLLQDVLEYRSAREKAIDSALGSSELGQELALHLRQHLGEKSPEDLAAALIAGVTSAELRTGQGLVHDLLDPHDFVIEPLPNLVFCRDSGAWIGDQAVVASLQGSRRREAELVAVIYEHHPRFAGLKRPYRPSGTSLDGGDVLLLGPGVLAVGVGVRSTPASAELLSKHLLDSGVARAVLAVPMNQRAAQGGTGRQDGIALDGPSLDAVCTVLDAGVVLMAPALAFTLTALTITVGRDGVIRVSRPRPFLEAAARALEIESLTVIDTGVVSWSRSATRWDDGSNALALGSRVLICDERNVETNARLTAAGFEVITVPCGELGGIRGGPRCMCAPLSRDAAGVSAAHGAGEDGAGEDEQVSERGPSPADLIGVGRSSLLSLANPEPAPGESAPGESAPGEPAPGEPAPGELAPLR